MHTIEGAKRSAYRAAAELAKELRGYAERADQTVEFAAWVRKVRTDNTRRRALQNELTWRRRAASGPRRGLAGALGQAGASSCLRRVRSSRRCAEIQDAEGLEVRC